MGFIVRRILEKEGKQNLQEYICHLLQIKMDGFSLTLHQESAPGEHRIYSCSVGAWQLMGSSAFTACASGMGTAFIEHL